MTEAGLSERPWAPLILRVPGSRRRSWTRSWPRPGGRRQRRPLPAGDGGPGGPLADRRRAPAGRGLAGQAGAERRRPAQGAGRAADLSDRRAAGGADPRRARRGGDAALHLPDAPRREGRGPPVRRPGPVPPARRPGAARRGPRRPCRAGSTRPPAPSSSPARRAAARRRRSTRACASWSARRQGRRSLATLEDPVESAVAGVAQAQVNPAAGLTLESGLRPCSARTPR